MKISVALCTYNGEKYLDVQLQSILDQTLAVHEIIVCDDCSTDKTAEILEKYKQSDSRFKIYKNKTNIGTIGNFEKAISLCSGDYIFLSDQDDIWRPAKVKVMIDFFEKNKTCLALFTNGNLIDAENNQLGATLWSKWNFNTKNQCRWLNNTNAMIDLIQNINYVTGAAMAFSSKLKPEIFPVETPVLYWHDAWIAMHAAYHNGLFYLNENTIDYRIHENQLIGVNIQNKTVNSKHISVKKYKKVTMKKFPEFSEIIGTIQQRKTFFQRVIKKILKLLNKK